MQLENVPDHDEEPIDWGDTCLVCGATPMTVLCNNAVCDGRPPLGVDWDDPQPEGDFSGSSEDEEWGGR